MIRTAISPRFAIRSLGLLATRVSCLPWTSARHAAPGVLSRDDLLAALAAIAVDAPVRAEEVTGSTNATAIELAEAGSPEWTLVSAAHQTEGRGRLGRTWTRRPRAARCCSRSSSGRRCRPAGRACCRCSPAPAMAEAIRRPSGRRRDRASGRTTCCFATRRWAASCWSPAVDDDVLRYVVVGIGVNLQSPADVEGAGAIGDRVGHAAICSPRSSCGSPTSTRATTRRCRERVRHAWLARVRHDRPRSARRDDERRPVVVGHGPWASTVSARSSCRPTTASSRSASARSSICARR